MKEGTVIGGSLVCGKCGSGYSGAHQCKSSHMKKAVVLTSGGLDSTTCLGMAVEMNMEVYPLSVEYGQKHHREAQSIKDVVLFYRLLSDKIVPYGREYQVKKLKTVSIDLRAIGGSALTDDSIEVPTDGDEAKMSEEIPSTYVPARNTILLSIALAYSEVVEADEIWIGANQLDYSGYPDCRGEFLLEFEMLANYATKRGVEGHYLSVKAPLLKLTKAEIIKRGMELGVPYHLTWSCYQGESSACGVCDSCVLRLKGFEEANVQDPITYQ